MEENYHHMKHGHASFTKMVGMAVNSREHMHKHVHSHVAADLAFHNLLHRNVHNEDSFRPATGTLPSCPRTMSPPSGKRGGR